MANLGSLPQFAADPAQGVFLDGSVLLTQPQAETLLARLTYQNLHTLDLPGGELRGQRVVAVVPEPAAWPYALVLLSLPLWRVALRPQCGASVTISPL